MITAHHVQSDSVSTRPISVRRPVKAKNTGRNITRTRSAMRVVTCSATRLLVRQDCAEQERAEDRVNADELGGDRGQQHRDQHQRQAIARRDAARCRGASRSA